VARRDLVGAAGLAVVAAVYLGANRHHALDTLAAPGPGVFPLAVGLSMLGLAIGQAIGAIRSRGRLGKRAPERHGRVLVLVAVLIASVAAIGIAGFAVASFTLVLLSSRLLGARDWLRPGALAIGVTIAIHVIFVLWLGVPLPGGRLP
jgi:hypothetical protein